MDFDLYQLLIAGHYLGQLPFTVGTQKLPVFFGKLFGINGLAVFQHHMGGADEGEMILQDGGCVVHAHEDDGTAGFLGHFKSALLEGEKLGLILVFVPCAFREDTHGNSSFDLLNAGEDGLKSFLDVCPVQEKTVKTFHPCGKKRDFFQTVLCHIAVEPGSAGVGDDDVEEAPVVSDIKDRNVLRHMFLADVRYFYSCQPLEQPEYELNDMKRAFVTKLRVLFSDEPFHHKDRNG